MNQTKQLTKGLFIDSCPKDKVQEYKPKWTLRLEDYEQDGVVYKSAYQLYMNSSTEFEAAMILMDGLYEKWKKLQNVKWFLNGRDSTAPAHIGLEAWREHKQLQDYTRQIKNLEEKAANGDTNAAKAVIALIEKADKQSKAGRPKKDKVDDPIKGMVADFQKAKKRFNK